MLLQYRFHLIANDPINRNTDILGNIIYTIHLLIHVQFFIIGIHDRDRFVVIRLQTQIEFEFAPRLDFSRIPGKRFDCHPFQFRKNNRKSGTVLHEACLQRHIRLSHKCTRISCLTIRPRLEFIIFISHSRHRNRISMIDVPGILCILITGKSNHTISRLYQSNQMGYTGNTAHIDNYVRSLVT